MSYIVLIKSDDLNHQSAVPGLRDDSTATAGREHGPGRQPGIRPAAPWRMRVTGGHAGASQAAGCRAVRARRAPLRAADERPGARAGDGGIRCPVPAARRVHRGRRRDLRPGPDRVRAGQHGPDRTLAVPAVPGPGRRGRRLRRAADPPRRAGRIRARAPPGRLGPGRGLRQLQLDPRAAPPRRPRGIRAHARRRRRLVRVHPAGTAAAGRGPGRPADGRAALAVPGRAHPRAAAARRRRAHLGAGSYPPRPDRAGSQAAVPAPPRTARPGPGRPAGSPGGPARPHRRAPRARRPHPRRLQRPGRRCRRAPPGPGTHPDRAPGPAGLHHRRARPGRHRQPDHRRRRPARRHRPCRPPFQAAHPGASRPRLPSRPLPACPASRCPDPRSAGPAQETEPADSGQADGGHDADLDGEIIAAAAGILAEARRHGERLSQKALGGKLRRDGYRVANDSLRGLLAAASGQIGASSPPEPGKTPGGPAAPERLVNGSDTALASRLPGHEPGSGAAGPPGAQ